MQKWFIVIALIATVLVALPQIAGCSLADVVQTKVPNGVQRGIGSPSSVTLREAEYTWEEWINYVETNSRQFADNIDRSNQLFGILAAFSNTGLNALDNAIGQTPLGAVALTGLGGLAGLFLTAPGTTRRIQKEKEESYNAGLFKGKQIAETLK